MLLTYRHPELRLRAFLDTEEGTVELCDEGGPALQYQESRHVGARQYEAACVAVAGYAGFSTSPDEWEFLE